MQLRIFTLNMIYYVNNLIFKNKYFIQFEHGVSYNDRIVANCVYFNTIFSRVVLKQINIIQVNKRKMQNLIKLSKMNFITHQYNSIKFLKKKKYNYIAHLNVLNLSLSEGA